MSVLIGRNTRLVVQGITGRDGSFHTKSMIDYGTKVVAGVSPMRPGIEVHGVPVFAGVREAVAKTRANTSVIYVPWAFAADAIYEAADAGVDLIVCISEGIPVRDMIQVHAYLEGLKAKHGGKGPRLVGANCPGLISPGQCKVGIMPGHIHKPGRVGLVSRSGTLTYEVVYQLTQAGIGQSTCIGIGGDPVLGTNFLDALQLFESDPGTDAVMLIGEIGGNDEEQAARFIQRQMTKPVVAFIAGRTAPAGKRMGHAGAIVTGGTGTAAEKIAAFHAVGVAVAEVPSDIPVLMKQALAGRRKPKAAAMAKAEAKAKAPAKPKPKPRPRAKPKPRPKPKSNARPKPKARPRPSSRPKPKPKPRHR